MDRLGFGEDHRSVPVRLHNGERLEEAGGGLVRSPACLPKHRSLDLVRSCFRKDWLPHRNDSWKESDFWKKIEII